MHWANLRAVESCAGVSFALKEPGGCSSLHALTALFHSAGLTLIPKDGNSPDAFGSGKSPPPFPRMPWVNFPALSRAVRFLFPPVPELLAVPVSEGAFEPQPALITASMARAAS